MTSTAFLHTHLQLSHDLCASDSRRFIPVVEQVTSGSLRPQTCLLLPRSGAVRSVQREALPAPPTQARSTAARAEVSEALGLRGRAAAVFCRGQMSQVERPRPPYR